MREIVLEDDADVRAVVKRLAESISPNKKLPVQYYFSQAQKEKEKEQKEKKDATKKGQTTQKKLPPTIPSSPHPARGNPLQSRAKGDVVIDVDRGESDRLLEPQRQEEEEGCCACCCLF